jgi:hypothetical protein
MISEGEFKFTGRPVDLIFKGRREAIAANKCLQPPIGCGKPIEPFKDALSATEYSISGLLSGMPRQHNYGALNGLEATTDSGHR